MAEESQEASRSIADEIGENIMRRIETPAEIFFFALFVIGALTLAATTLVGSCGNVDDEALLRETRTLEYLPGSVVVTTSSVILSGTTIGPGACAIISSVDEEQGTARAHVLAKAQPFFTGSPEEYRPSSALSGFLSAPFSTLLFLHSGPPEGEISLAQLSPVATQPYTNFFRSFYLNSFYIILGILSVIIIFLTYVGARFEKKRTTWYARHTLRATYISRLMRDRERTRALQDLWGNVSVPEEGQAQDPEAWKRSLNLLQEILDGVLTLLRFEGENLTEKLQSMSERDLWNVDRLWKAHSLILHMQGHAGEGEEALPITERTVRKVITIHRESLIWLGLLPHHMADES